MGKEKAPDIKKFRRKINWLILGVIFLALILLIIYIIKIINTPLLSQLYTVQTPTPLPTLKINIYSPASEDQSQKNYEELAINDLAEKLNISKDIIKVDRVEPVEFSDTSLGCPEKNNMYAQVITPGFTVNLEVLGEIYTYNAGLNRVVSCKRN